MARRIYELCAKAFQLPVHHIIHLDDWVIMNERKARIRTVILAVTGVLVLLFRVPVKLASVSHTLLWAIAGISCLILSGLYAESLREIQEMPRIEYLKKRGIH